jgi:RNase P subunit RPR2
VDMDAHSLTLGIATLIVGALMAISGLEKHALEWKHRRRICPSCGRTLAHGRTCGCTHSR